MLRAALEAQQRRRFREAQRLYSEVLALTPNHFDAVHMLGVVHYQLGLFQDARRLLEQARTLRPRSTDVRSNLSLVLVALEHSYMEVEICHEVLPRMAALCAPPEALAEWVRRAASVHFVSCSIAPELAVDTCERLRAFCGHVPVRPWRGSEHCASSVAWEVLDAGTASLLGEGVVVACAGSDTMARWLDVTAPERAALVVTADEPGCVIDRLRELTGQGRRRAAILYASERVARAIRLSGTVLPQIALTAAA